jgi:hypothetical protein
MCGENDRRRLCFGDCRCGVRGSKVPDREVAAARKGLTDLACLAADDENWSR